MEIQTRLALEEEESKKAGTQNERKKRRRKHKRHGPDVPSVGTKRTREILFKIVAKQDEGDHDGQRIVQQQNLGMRSPWPMTNRIGPRYLNEPR